MIGRDNILQRLQERQEEMRVRFSVGRIGLFGSYLRGNASKKSDIDLVVDLTEPTFDHYMDLKYYIEALFERPEHTFVGYFIGSPGMKPSPNSNQRGKSGE